MTRVLLVKTSSLGDVIHALPAVTEAAEQIPGIRIDWLVEEAYVDIPTAHAAVERVVPVALRRWRRHLTDAAVRKEWREFRRQLGECSYDLVIDAQGLSKSAFLGRLARGPVAGYDRMSIREPLASLAYDVRYRVPREQHAVERIRQLLAQALGYEPGIHQPGFGIARNDQEDDRVSKKPAVLFVHGTTWETKKWPRERWQQLARLITAEGYRVLLPWGDSAEHALASEIAAGCAGAEVLPRLGLGEAIAHFRVCRGAVSVDSGLGHLCAALDIPTVALYGPTNPLLTSNYGPRQHQLQDHHLPCIPCLKRRCAIAGTSSKIFPPCFELLEPERIWSELKTLMTIPAAGIPGEA